MEQDPFQIGLTDLARITFGDKLLNLYQSGTGKRKKTVRGIWEPTQAAQQCRVLQKDKDLKEKFGEIIPNTGLCWICGFPIFKTRGLTAECEHILPIAQARFFLTLYSTSLKNRLIGTESIFKYTDDPNFDEQWVKWQVEAFKLEYDYAHSYCNQIKKDKSFIVTTHDRKYVVNTPLIKSYLSEIMYNTSRDGYQIIQDYINKYNKDNSFKWLDDRTVVLNDRYQKIINLVRGTTKDDVSNLILLSGMVGLVDPVVILPEFQKLIEENQGALRFVEHIRIDETILLNNGRAMIAVIYKLIERELIQLILEQKYDKYKVDILQSLQRIGAIIEKQFSNVILEHNTISDEDATNILAALKGTNIASLNTAFTEVEEFYNANMNQNHMNLSDSNESSNNNTSGNNKSRKSGKSNNMNLNNNLNNTNMNNNTDAKYLQMPEITQFIEIIKKPMQQYMFLLYKNVYNYAFTSRRELDVPDIAEPVAIDVVILFFFKYLLNICNTLEFHRDRVFPDLKVYIQRIVDIQGALVLRDRPYLTDDFKAYLCKIKSEYLPDPPGKHPQNSFNEYCQTGRVTLKRKKKGGRRTRKYYRSTRRSLKK